MAGLPGPQNRRESNSQADLHEDVGQRLRACREQRQLSLRELARRLGISPSAVSQIETGKSRPSVSTLYAIVTELEMSLDALFSSRPTHVRDGDRQGAAEQQRRSRAPTADASPRLQPAATRHAIDLESGVRWERLTPHADPEADFLYVVYDVGGSSSRDDRFMRHSGREYGLVTSGTLEVSVGFERYELRAGDSICFDSTVPHRLRNVGDEPVHGIWFVVGRDGDGRTRAFDRPPTGGD